MTSEEVLRLGFNYCEPPTLLQKSQGERFQTYVFWHLFGTTSHHNSRDLNT